MKIYRERETDNHFIFELRPHQLFDLATSEELLLHPNRREAGLRARNLQTRQLEEFAFAWNKKVGHDFARRSIESLPDEPAFAGDVEATKILTAST